MEEYNEFVNFLVTKGINKIFLNSDLDKMKAVFTEMFKSATQELRIFAGTLCNDVTDSEEYVETLSDFIEKGGKLRILLNNFDKQKAGKSRLFNRLTYYCSLNEYNIQVKSTKEEPYVVMGKGEKKNVHFAVGDKKSYRIETDIEKRNAVCNMNDPVNAGKYADFFDKIFDSNESEEINLKKLFLK